MAQAQDLVQSTSESVTGNRRNDQDEVSDLNFYTEQEIEKRGQ